MMMMAMAMVMLFVFCCCCFCAFDELAVWGLAALAAAFERTLRTKAAPTQRGRPTQVWEVPAHPPARPPITNLVEHREERGAHVGARAGRRVRRAAEEAAGEHRDDARLFALLRVHSCSRVCMCARGWFTLIGRITLTTVAISDAPAAPPPLRRLGLPALPPTRTCATRLRTSAASTFRSSSWRLSASANAAGQPSGQRSDVIASRRASRRGAPAARSACIARP